MPKKNPKSSNLFSLNLNLMEDWKLDWNPRGIVNVQSFWLRQLYLWSFLETVIIQTNDLTLDFRDIILNQHNQTYVLQEPPKQHENLWMYGHNGFVWEVYEIHCDWNWNWNNNTMNIIALKWKLNVICTEKLQWHWNTTAFSQCTHSSISGCISVLWM